MCERVVAMVTRREKFARTMHQSIYADDLASVLALLTRQQETIDRLREAAKGSAVIVNTAKEEVERLKIALREIRYIQPDPIPNSGFVTGPQALLDACKRLAAAALQAKPSPEQQVQELHTLGEAKP